MSIESGNATNSESAELDVLVPEDSQFDIEDWFCLEKTDGTNASERHIAQSKVKQRSTLYFGMFTGLVKWDPIILLIPRHSTDESIIIYLVLRLRNITEPDLLSFIQSLRIVLDVLAFTPQPNIDHGRHMPQSPIQPPHQDIIWSDNIDTSQKPILKFLDGSSTAAIWRIPVILSPCFMPYVVTILMNPQIGQEFDFCLH